MAAADAPTIAFASKAEFRAWLEEHHGDQDGIWLRLAKKASGIPSPTYAEALDVALCFGWIDGQKRPLDDRTGCSASPRGDRAASGRRSTSPRSTRWWRLAR